MSENDFLLSDVQWIRTGKTEAGGKRGDQEAPVDIDVLWKIIFKIEEGLSRKRMTLDPTKKARLISVLYEFSVNSGKSAGRMVVDSYLEFLL